MHEHGIAGDIVHVLMDKCRQNNAPGIRHATLQVSELSGMTQDALQMALDRACQEHDFPLFEVRMVKEGILGHCSVCGTIVQVDDQLNCCTCGHGPVQLMADEAILLLDYEFC